MAYLSPWGESNPDEVRLNFDAADGKDSENVADRGRASVAKALTLDSDTGDNTGDGFTIGVG